MEKFLSSRWSYVFVFAIYAICVCFMFGCNPAKRVMKNKDQFDLVGEAWSKDNPCANDTVTNFLPGDTLTQDGPTVVDTIYRKIAGDTILQTEIKTRTVYKTIHDTLVKYIRDTRAEKVLQSQLSRNQDSLNKIIIQRNAFEAQRNSWRGIVYAICSIAVLVLIGGYVFFRYYSRIK